MSDLTDKIEKIIEELTELQKQELSHFLLDKGRILKRLVGKTSVFLPETLVERLTCETPGYEKLRVTPLGQQVIDKLKQSNGDV